MTDTNVMAADGHVELRTIAELALHTAYSKSGDGNLYVFRADHARSDLFSACTPARIIALLDELEAQRRRISQLEAARFGYASEFAPNADGAPDVGSIHANIRALKAAAPVAPSGAPDLHDQIMRLTCVEVPAKMGDAWWYTIGHRDARHAAAELAAALAPASPASAPEASEPFMYGIMTSSGKAHMDEGCVSDDAGSLSETVFYLNDEQHTGHYKVVPVYTRPVAAPAAPEATTLPTRLRIYETALEHIATESTATPVGEARQALIATAAWESADFTAPVAPEQAQSVPDGWQLVPVVPTDEMRIACPCHEYFADIDADWAAMLAAAPLPPVVARKELSEADILEALASITHEPPQRLPPGWLKFAHAIAARLTGKPEGGAT